MANEKTYVVPLVYPKRERERTFDTRRLDRVQAIVDQMRHWELGDRGYPAAYAEAQRQAWRQLLREECAGIITALETVK